MKSYYIIWRGDEDEFFVTYLDLHPASLACMSNDQIVAQAFDVEYPQEENPVGGPDYMYELIEIIGGDNITFHMK